MKSYNKVADIRNELDGLSYAELQDLNNHLLVRMSMQKLDLDPEEHAILFRLSEELETSVGKIELETKAKLNVWVRYNPSYHKYEVAGVELQDEEETVEELENSIPMKLRLSQSEITLTKICKYAKELAAKYNATPRDILMRWTGIRLSDQQIETRLK